MNQSKMSNEEIRNISMAIHDIFLETEVLADMTASERQIAAKQRESVDIAAAQGLMRQFIEAANSGEGPIPEALIAHVALSFSAYLDNGSSLDQAFGVKNRRRGRPPNPTQTDLGISMHILSFLLDGSTLDSALREVAQIVHKGERGLETIWAAMKHEAVTVVRLQRLLEGESFSDSEKAVLRRVSKKIQL